MTDKRIDRLRDALQDVEFTAGRLYDHLRGVTLDTPLDTRVRAMLDAADEATAALKAAPLDPEQWKIIADTVFALRQPVRHGTGSADVLLRESEKWPELLGRLDEFESKRQQRATMGDGPEGEVSEAATTAPDATDSEFTAPASIAAMAREHNVRPDSLARKLRSRGVKVVNRGGANYAEEADAARWIDIVVKEMRESKGKKPRTATHPSAPVRTPTQPGKAKRRK